MSTRLLRSKSIREVNESSPGKTQSWSEALHPMSRLAVVKKKRPATHLEQSELWPSAVEASARGVEAVIPVEDMNDAIPFIEVKQMRPVTTVAVKTAARTVPTQRAMPVTASVRKSAAPFQSIVRFLNVNGAIEGMKTGGMRFDLPGRGLSQTLRLWRGTNYNESYPTAP